MTMLPSKEKLGQETPLYLISFVWLSRSKTALSALASFDVFWSLAASAPWIVEGPYNSSITSSSEGADGIGDTERVSWSSLGVTVVNPALWWKSAILLKWRFSFFRNAVFAMDLKKRGPRLVLLVMLGAKVNNDKISEQV